MPRGYQKGLVRDAASAKVAAQVNELLWECDLALGEHWNRCHQGLYGNGFWVNGLELDLSAIRGRLERVRRMVCGELAEEIKGEAIT